MRVVTWNTLHPDHTNVYEDKSNAEYLAWSYRRTKIIERLRTYAADIICLQEVDSSTIIEDFSELKDYELVYQNDKTRTKKLKLWLANPDTKKPNTLVCAILVKKEFAEIVSTMIGSRSISVVIKTPDDKKIKISNVHLECERGATEIHKKHLAKLLDSDIICGDFNEFPDEPSIEYMTASGFNNAYQLKSPKYTFKDSVKEWVIDYVFYKGSILHAEWLYFTGVGKSHPSDHSPVLVELK